MSRIALGVVVTLGTASLLLSGCSSSGPAPAHGVSINSADGAAAGQSQAGTAPSPPASASPAVATGALDVCSLMTAAQASAINHVTYGATKSQHVQAGYDLCTYANTGKSADPVDIQELTVSVIAIPDCYAQLKKADGPGKAVSGVGDAAFGYSIGVVFQVKNTCLDVSGLTHAELGNDYTHDIAMAKIIIGKLPA